MTVTRQSLDSYRTVTGQSTDSHQTVAILLVFEVSTRPSVNTVEVKIDFRLLDEIASIAQLFS